MLKKEQTAAKRFAQTVANANGKDFAMTKMTLLESGGGENGIDYVMFEYSDGTQWQVSPTSITEYTPMDDLTEDAFASALLPSMEQSLSAFEKSGYVGGFWDWFNALSVDEIADIKAQEFQSTGMEIVPQDDTELLASNLSAATEYIRQQVDIVAHSFCKIGFKLLEVRENQWYKALGFKSVTEYGEKVLGFKKSSVSNYIMICERFSVYADGKPSAQLSDDFSSFSYTQLSEMLTLPAEKLDSVTPDMTCKEVRALKKQEVDEEEEEDEEEEDLEQPYNLFCRVLTENNLDTVINLLKDVIGKDIQIIVG